MEKQLYFRRLPLSGAFNTRDLGGYPCAGGATHWGVFLRSASPASFTAEDVQKLKAYGLTTAIDLRSCDECRRQPSMLENIPGITVHKVPLLDQVHSQNFEGDLPGSMSGLYISLLENNAADFKTIFTLLAEAEGCALFNCTAGKDRTGVVAMLLLGLAGVDNLDIEADYAMTEIYMRETFAAMMADFAAPELVFRSLPESMRRVLLHLQEKYGSAQDYLQQAGLSSAVMETLKTKFVDFGG